MARYVQAMIALVALWLWAGHWCLYALGEGISVPYAPRVAATSAITTARPLNNRAAAPCSTPAQELPGPAMGTITGLAAVGPNDLWVVGTPGADRAPLEHWDGRQWHPARMPQPAALLNAITALSSSDIWAVGETVPTSLAADHALIEHWDGSRWQIVPNPDHAGGQLFGVAATAHNDVWAVGSEATGALIEHWDGRQWSIVASPNAGQFDNRLQGVAAIAPDDAWAVGRATGKSYTKTVTEHWDGSKWQIVPSPTPGDTAGLGEDNLLAVAAVSREDVWAVGYSQMNRSVDSIDTKALIEHWDGSRWRVMPIPYAGAYAQLAAVAALSPTNVWATGNGDGALVERWDGTRWRTVPHLSRGPLVAVAPIAPSSVFVAGAEAVVGSAPPSARVFVERYGQVACYDGNPVVRTIPLPFSPRTAVLGQRAGRIFVAGPMLAVVDATSGALVRIVPLSGTAMAMASAEQAGHVFVASSGAAGACPGTVAMFDGNTGTLLHSASLPNAPITLAVDQRAERIFVVAAQCGPSVSRLGSVSMLDARTGVVVRTVTVGLDPVAVAIDESTNRVFVVNQGPVESPPSLSGSPVTRPIGAGTVSVLDAGTGDVLATVSVGPFAGAVAVSPRMGRVYVRSDIAGLSVLDARTGGLVRTVVGHTRIEAAEPGGLTVDEPASRIFLGDVTNALVPNVYVLDGQSGAFQEPLYLGPASGTVAVDRKAGRLLIAAQQHYNRYGQPNGGGVLTTLDASSRQVLGQIPIGYLPVATLVDERSGYAYVVTAGSVTGTTVLLRGGGIAPPGNGTIVVLNPTSIAQT